MSVYVALVQPPVFDAASI